MTTNHHRILGKAIERARDMGMFPHRMAAIVVQKGKIVSIGVNSRRNLPRYAGRDDCSVHAEVAALRRVARPRGAHVYVVRLTPGGRIGLARPCERCWQILVTAQVRCVTYTTNNGEISHERVR
jgi:pyrimidine deaminase RibD-like protein